MPKESDYSKGIIYKLCCRDITIKEIYVGSSCNFGRRKSNHKGACNNLNDSNYNFYVYKFIRDNGGWDNWRMVLIKEYPCKSKLELHKEEQSLIDELGSTLNMIHAYISVEQSKENAKEHAKEYYQRPDIKEERKEYYQRPDIKEHTKEYYKEYYKEYKELKKDEINISNREYREKNRCILADKGREKQTCPCGSTFNKSGITQHRKTLKHITYLEKTSS